MEKMLLLFRKDSRRQALLPGRSNLPNFTFTIAKTNILTVSPADSIKMFKD